MINGRTVLGIIPARGGSKGLPKKNLLDVAGRPMVAWGIEVAKKSRFIDRTIVSTDSEEIAAVARQWGGDVPFLRPAALAQDESPMDLAVVHALDSIGSTYDYFVLMEPTVPLKSAEDIDGCIALCVERGAPASIALSEPQHPPYWMVSLDADNRVAPILGEEAMHRRRQDLPKAYILTGAAYVAQCDWYRQTRSFVDPRTVGYITEPARSIDVDTEHDLKMVRLFAEHGRDGL